MLVKRSHHTAGGARHEGLPQGTAVTAVLNVAKIKGEGFWQLVISATAATRYCVFKNWQYRQCSVLVM